MFNQTTEYALRAMAVLALEPDVRASSGALAERTQAPMDYLSKVLQSLASAGLIEGRRGVRGGYKVTRAPEKIQLLDIINAVSPLERIRECPLGLKSHGVNLCPLHRKMDEAIGAVVDIFRDVSLADLLNEPGASTPLCEQRPSGQSGASLTVGGGSPSGNGRKGR
ncbi:MAG: Rrf2 family transcriptional regulator [Phycisphaerales bacterium]